MFVAAGCVSGFVACGSATGPLPKGALPLDPPPVIYSVYWSEVEQCAGQNGDFAGTRFYYVPGDGGFPVGGSADVVGVWQPETNSITLAQYVMDNPLVVRHEMLHAILKRTDHPAQYFADQCAALVTH